MQPAEFPRHLIDDADRAGGDLLTLAAGGPLDVLVVLGSGLADALDEAPTWAEPLAVMKQSDLPGVLAPVGDGHVDELRTYRHHGKRVAVALGRTHLFEGHGPRPVTALARAAHCAGVHTAVLTNANGCLRDWQLGEVMAITDHVNLTGTSPFDGTVFLDPSTCWDEQLTAVLSEVCQRTGTYAFLRGPEYQTRAETRLLAAAEVDCVGMSTVLEALMLHALGVRVCGMSVVSDLSLATTPTDPSAVLDAAAQARTTVLAGLEAVLKTP
ncbi:MAG: purine-nucleoside phosphorylase [Propionibacteriaceae bacterium]|nr:purine-nucleoside phosphorylase [Propionibacteriaceae bacterium]MDO5066862.1 purine-nucleoside phosphorylase [Propionibacteriaceae bacterium]